MQSTEIRPATPGVLAGQGSKEGREEDRISERLVEARYSFILFRHESTTGTGREGLKCSEGFSRASSVR